jgi:hypothetical protein
MLKYVVMKPLYGTLQSYSQAQRDYLPEMVQRLLPENQEPERRRPAFTPEKVLANLRRLRLRSGVRVRDVQDLTRHQRDGKLTVAEFRSLLREVVCSVLPDHVFFCRVCVCDVCVCDCVCVFWVVLEGSLHCSSATLKVCLNLYRARDKRIQRSSAA